MTETKYIQLQVITAYPPACLNRDEFGKLKTVEMGGVQRARISSQCLKRALRCSTPVADMIDRSLLAVRTRRFGKFIYDALTTGKSVCDLINNELSNGGESVVKNKTIDPELADIITTNTMLFLGKGEDKKARKNDDSDESDDIEGDQAQAEIEDDPEDSAKKYMTKEISVLAWDEIARLDTFLTNIANGDKELIDFVKKGPSNKNNAVTVRTYRKNFQEKTEILSKTPAAVDTAMFGRMFASNPAYSIEAAVQVSHAFTVHKTAAEGDFFSAVDDLNAGDDSGSAHLNEAEYAAGLYYLYIVIDRELLKKNLGGDKAEALTKNAIAAFTEAVLTVSPTGKQNSFASRARASYALAEKGNQLPFSLCSAFLTPIRGERQIEKAIERLNTTLGNFEKVYGKIYDTRMDINALTGEGKFDKFVEFVSM